MQKLKFVSQLIHIRKNKKSLKFSEALFARKRAKINFPNN